MKYNIKKIFFHYCIIGTIMCFFILIGIWANKLPLQYVFILIGYQIYYSGNCGFAIISFGF